MPRRRTAVKIAADRADRLAGYRDNPATPGSQSSGTAGFLGSAPLLPAQRFQLSGQSPKLAALLGDQGEGVAAMRSVVILVASIVVLTAGGTAIAGSGLTGAPGPGITGNDAGGIIPYSPYIEGVYQRMAANHCARWGRLSHITSVHRQYGDYIAFVCIDKPWMIH